jgi:cytochrome c oxidase subunit 3
VTQDAHAEHFESMARQAHAARLGMWVFLASEVLLFAALFALYATYRAEHAHAFHEAIAHSRKTLGSINTGVLLFSSTLVALAVHAIRKDRRLVSALLVSGAIALGGVFLVLKFTEYAGHFEEGISPGKNGQFWTLYFTMTGLHAVHVMVGMSVLAFTALGLLRGKITRTTSHRVEVAAIYWHLVDVVWIFLWPLFYLA